MAERRRKIASDYAQRHPARAAEERALRKAQAAAAASYGHKRHGTVETHARAAVVRQGALARLYQSGAISIDQLGWALEIQAEHERIEADVMVRGASLETRVDVSRGGHEAFFERLGEVRRAMAYSQWRATLSDICGGQALGIKHLLALVVDDLPVTEAAKRLRMSVRRTRGVLIRALDLWPRLLGEARRDVDEEDLMRAHRRIGVA